MVEANGCLLILEWKTINVDLPTGQKIMFEKITKRSKSTTVFFINGIVFGQQVKRLRIYSNGVIKQDINPACNNDLIEQCKLWETWARYK